MDKQKILEDWRWLKKERKVLQRELEDLRRENSALGEELSRSQDIMLGYEKEIDRLEAGIRELTKPLVG